MIAMIVAGDDLTSGPIPIALAYAGFEIRKTFTMDEAERSLSEDDSACCVLVLEAGALGRRVGSATRAGTTRRGEDRRCGRRFSGSNVDAL